MSHDLRATVEDSRLYDVLFTEDALGVVLRAHLVVEQELIALIEEAAPQPEAIVEMRLDYQRRVALAVLLGLNPTFLKPLKMLGNLRNKFAHKLDFALSKADAKELFNALADDHRQALVTVYDGLSRKPDRPPRFIDNDPIDVVRLTTIVLRQALRAARVKVAEARRKEAC